MMSMNYRRTLGILSLGLAAYFVFGFGIWILKCKSNHYFQHRLGTLAFLELVSGLNRCVLAFAILVSGILILTIVARIVRPWLGIKVVDQRKLGGFVLSAGLLLFLTILAALLGFEIRLASALNTPSYMEDILHRIFVRLSDTSSLKTLLLLVAAYSSGAIALVAAATGFLARHRNLQLRPEAPSWLDKRRMGIAGVCQLLALAGLNIYIWWGEARHANDGPNVILISIDTLRADHLDAYGYGRKTASNIAALAARGFVFSNAYAQAPWTLPSMASMVTGLYPFQHGAVSIDTAIRPDAITLAEVLKNNSYLTMCVTSAAFVSRNLGFSKGFDIFDQTHMSAALSITSRGVTEAAIRQLREHRGRKLFLWIHYFDPHAAYMRHPEYGYADHYAGLLGPAILEPADVIPIKSRLSVEDRQFIQDVYDEEISFTDSAIGLLLRALPGLGLADHTIIILTADHGEEFFERDTLGHARKLYQELIHVPLIIAGVSVPGIRQLDTSKSVELRSLGRTILNLCGAREAPFPGIDLLAPVEGGKDPGPQVVFSEGSHFRDKKDRREAAIGLGWKLIHNLKDGSYELYDLQHDPQEKQNLFAKTNGEQQRIGSLLARELGSFRTGAQAAGRSAKLKTEEINQLRSLGYIQ